MNHSQPGRISTAVVHHLATSQSYCVAASGATIDVGGGGGCGGDRCTDTDDAVGAGITADAEVDSEADAEANPEADAVPVNSAVSEVDGPPWTRGALRATADEAIERGE